MTVQLLEENACCSIAWKTLRRPRLFLRVGQRSKTRFDQKVKTILCKTDNFVPLVVPRLSANSGSNSSLTSRVQDLSSTSPAEERGDGQASGKLERITSPTPKTKIKRGMAIEIRTTVCEIFLNCWRSSQIIWSTQKCVHPHTCLRTQIRNVPAQVVSKSRKHSTYIHFPKGRNCEVCLRTKMTSAPLQKITRATSSRSVL